MLLERFHRKLVETYRAYPDADRRAITAAVENLQDKYAVTVREIARALVDEKDLVLRERATAVPRELVAARMPRGRVGRARRSHTAVESHCSRSPLFCSPLRRKDYGRFLSQSPSALPRPLDGPPARAAISDRSGKLRIPHAP